MAQTIIKHNCRHNVNSSFTVSRNPCHATGSPLDKSQLQYAIRGSWLLQLFFVVTIIYVLAVLSYPERTVGGLDERYIKLCYTVLPRFWAKTISEPRAGSPYLPIASEWHTSIQRLCSKYEQSKNESSSTEK